MTAKPKRTRAAKIRADVALVARGLVDSRARAQALIMAGLVFSGERRITKAGDTLAADAPLELRGQDHPWVSRGGLKLDHALDHFAIDVAGCIGLDVGASTGGFTDVLLSRGAARVFAVDVGHGQLAWKLRNDDRVVVLERTNARHLTAEQVPEPAGNSRSARARSARAAWCATRRSTRPSATASAPGSTGWPAGRSPTSSRARSPDPRATASS